MKIVIGLIFIIMGLITMGMSSMGTRPNEERIKKYRNSKKFDNQNNVFVNRRARIIEAMWDRNFSFKNMFSFFKERKDAKPSDPMPEVKPNLEDFLRPGSELKVIWFGHSSFLLNMDGKIVLVDPVFSGSAAPVSFMVKRFQAPVLQLNELPAIDYILISHDHYDHLDMESIKYFADKKTQFVTPLGVGSHLEGWGVSKENITERDWWQSADLEGIKFIATPAQHFSGRGLSDRNSTLWASWVLQSENHNIYFSGDSGYDVHFKQIGEKFGPFDVAFIESGQYNEKWREVHMLPTEAVEAYKDLKAKKYFPVHWGMFVLSYHAWYDPMEQLFKLSKENKVDLVVPKIGQIVNFTENVDYERWWEKRTIQKEVTYAELEAVVFENK